MCDDIEEGLEDIDFAEDALDAQDTPDKGYVAILETTLAPGSLITINGYPEVHCQRFSINLGMDAAGNGDLLLHFNPRMAQRYVVRNSRRRGVWGNEETTSFRGFPFECGQPFRVDIYVTEDNYLISVDGTHYCMFPHRIPFASATWMAVGGGAVSVLDVRVHSAPTYPVTLPGAPPLPELSELTHPSYPEQKWSNPAVALLPNGLKSGWQVVIRGRIRLLPHSFHINLADSPHQYPQANILLHVNPRFDAHAHHCRQNVVFNDWVNGIWGKEQRQRSARLAPGAQVEMRIVREDNVYLIWVCSQLLGAFNARADPSCVRVLVVRGDIQLYAMYMSEAVAGGGVDECCDGAIEWRTEDGVSM